MLDKLSNLLLEEKSLKRVLDCTYNRKIRTRILKRLVVVKREIKETKEKLRIERMIKNDNGNRPGKC